jgi:hypothetical protein
VADSDTPPEDSDSLLDSHFTPQTARRNGPFNYVDRDLEQQRQHGGGNGAGQDQRDIIEPDSPQNRLPQTSGADDGSQRREADVLHCCRADSGQHCRQGDRELDGNEPRQGTKAQNGSRFDRPAWDAVDGRVGISHDLQQAITEQRRHGRHRTFANAAIAKRGNQRQQEDQQGERWNRLQQPHGG